MKLFKIDEHKLKSIPSTNFSYEREMQNLTENNMTILLGVDFLQSEFTVDKYRLDSVAFDSDTNSFVIVEYKNNTNSSVIDQGYSYLNTMLNHKADFVLLYNHVYDKNESKKFFDWSQTRIIFVAKGFTQYQRDAVDNPELPIELYEVKKYKNNYLTLNQIEKSKIAQSSRIVDKDLKDTSKIDTAKEIKLYTENDQLVRGSQEVQDLYQKLKDTILSWDSNISLKATKLYLGFRLNKHNVTDIEIRKKQIKLWINLKKGELNDPRQITRDVSHTGHWGNGDFEIVLKNDDDLEYILSLIKQSWKKAIQTEN